MKARIFLFFTLFVLSCGCFSTSSNYQEPTSLAPQFSYTFELYKAEWTTNTRACESDKYDVIQLIGKCNYFSSCDILIDGFDASSVICDDKQIYGGTGIPQGTYPNTGETMYGVDQFKDHQIQVCCSWSSQKICREVKIDKKC